MALNNIQYIENLRGCEALKKLDLTCNFVDDLSCLYSLEKNEELRELYLTGNPCTSHAKYRSIVVRILPQLTVLDGIAITVSDRLRSKQLADDDLPKRKSGPKNIILPTDVKEEDLSIIDPDDITGHDPKSRIQVARITRKQRDAQEKKGDQEKQQIIEIDPNPKFHPESGKIMQRNHLNVDFSFSEDPNEIELIVKVSKFLDTSLIDVNLQSTWIAITVKGKGLHLALPCEIIVDKSELLRSKATGYLLIKMPRVRKLAQMKQLLPNGAKQEVENNEKRRPIIYIKEKTLKKENIPTEDDLDIPPLI